jgi:hypothetical protein
VPEGQLDQGFLALDIPVQEGVVELEPLGHVGKQPRWARAVLPDVRPRPRSRPTAQMAAGLVGPIWRVIFHHWQSGLAVSDHVGAARLSETLAYQPLQRHTDFRGRGDAGAAECHCLAV